MQQQPKKISELTDEMLSQSERFKQAQLKYNAKINSTAGKSDYEIEYGKRIFAEKAALPQITEQQARDIFWSIAIEVNPNYKISDEVKPIYRELVNYFFGFESAMDLSKGLMLVGGTGSGKTQFFKIMQRALQFTGKSFRLLNCIEVEQLIRFGSDYEQFDGGEVVFDDLGAEQLETLMYGNRVVVMAEIIQRRYNRDVRTHITTNYLIEDIESRYGTRVSDRIKERCNIVFFTGDSFRK